jgi:hypothetical protein
VSQKVFVLHFITQTWTCSAVNEINPDPGAVQSFLVGQNGTLSAPVDTVNSGGAGPPFVNPFSSGSIAVVNVRPHSLQSMNHCSNLVAVWGRQRRDFSTFK